MRLILAACILLGAVSWSRAADDADLREDGVLYFEDNLPDRIVVAVKTPTVLYLHRDFGTQLALFLPGQKIEFIGMGPEGYLVKGDYRNNAVTGWIKTADVPPGLDPKLIAKAKKNQDRRDKVAVAIKAKKVLRGMTPDEVRQALGRPDQTASRTDDDGQALTWNYTTYAIVWRTAATPTGYGNAVVQTFPSKVPIGQMIITFSNGVVTAIEEQKTNPDSPSIQSE